MFVLLRSNICEPRSWLVFVSQEMRKRDARRKLTGHLVSALLGHEKRTPILARFSLVFLRDQTIQTSIESWSASQSPFRQLECVAVAVSTAEPPGVPGSPREPQRVPGVPGSPRESLGAKKCVADANAYPSCDVASANASHLRGGYRRSRIPRFGARKCVASVANAYPICDVASVANAYPICDVATVANAYPICDVATVANACPIWCVAP